MKGHFNTSDGNWWKERNGGVKDERSGPSQSGPYRQSPPFTDTHSINSQNVALFNFAHLRQGPQVRAASLQLEPVDGGTCGEGRCELQRKHAQRLSRRLW